MFMPNGMTQRGVLRLKDKKDRHFKALRPLHNPSEKIIISYFICFRLNIVRSKDGT